MVKADGLAAGKGVVIAEQPAKRRMLAIDDHAGQGRRAKVVIEEFMAGEEVSLFALSDGERTMPVRRRPRTTSAPSTATSGPTPAAWATYCSAAGLHRRSRGRGADRAIVAPAIAGLAAEGAPYRGVLYAGLMLTPDGPRLVEFNARFGDPECQVLMMRLDSDIVPYLHGLRDRRARLELPPPAWSTDWAICVVLAASGIRGRRGPARVIGARRAAFGEDVAVFHAGTARRADGALVAAGGRVLNVCARAPDPGEAPATAPTPPSTGSTGPSGFHRTDIGWRALRRDQDRLSLGAAAAPSVK